jgi:hypothetical protein
MTAWPRLTTISLDDAGDDSPVTELHVTSSEHRSREPGPDKAPAAAPPAPRENQLPQMNAAHIARDKRLILGVVDARLVPRDHSRLRRAHPPDPVERQQQVRDAISHMDPDMVVLFGVADTDWAGDLAKRLLPAFPHIAYRASSGGGPPGGAIAVLSRHRFAGTKFHPLEPVYRHRQRAPDPGILLATVVAGALGRVRLAVMETGHVPRRAANEPRAGRVLRQQIQEIVTTVMDPAVPYPTLLIGTPPIWPDREQAAWSALLAGGMVDGLMAAEPPVDQGIYDPHVGGLPADQRHHLFMRVGDFAHMFIDRIETLEGAATISLGSGAWAHLPRHRPLRVTLTPRIR